MNIVNLRYDKDWWVSIQTHNCQSKSQSRVSGQDSVLHNLLLHMIYLQFNVSTTFPKPQHQDTGRDFGAAFFLCTIDGLHGFWGVLRRGFSLKQKIQYWWCRQTIYHTVCSVAVERLEEEIKVYNSFHVRRDNFNLKKWKITCSVMFYLENPRYFLDFALSIIHEGNYLRQYNTAFLFFHFCSNYDQTSGNIWWKKDVHGNGFNAILWRLYRISRRRSCLLNFDRGKESSHIRNYINQIVIFSSM